MPEPGKGSDEPERRLPAPKDLVKASVTSAANTSGRAQDPFVSGPPQPAGEHEMSDQRMHVG